MVILVCSCDKNQDLWAPFRHCLEKYWPGHPEVIYSTETVTNPFYKTICKNFPVEKFSKRIRETLAEIDDRAVLVMVDDIFIRQPVNTERVYDAERQLTGNIALLNFEKAWDDNFDDIGLNGFLRRKKGATYEISFMCGLWDREKLMDILSTDMSPWQIEMECDSKGYDYCVNSGDYIIDWGYRTFCNVGVMKGKWSREIVPFFEKEGIEMDYSIRGFYD